MHPCTQIHACICTSAHTHTPTHTHTHTHHITSLLFIQVLIHVFKVRTLVLVTSTHESTCPFLKTVLTLDGTSLLVYGFIPSLSHTHTHTHTHTHPHSPISDDNRGRRMLKKMGWKEGEGLGKDNAGIAEPVSFKFQEIHVHIALGG